MRLPSALLCGACLLLALAAPPESRAETFVLSGVTRLRLDPIVLDNLGLQVEGSEIAAVREGGALQAELSGGGFQTFAGGALGHAAAFALASDRGRVDLAHFSLRPLEGGRALELRDARGRGWLRVRSAHVRVRQERLSLRHADLLLTARLADWIGRPDLRGAYLGTLEADWVLSAGAPTGDPSGALGCEPDFTPPIDLSLIDLASVSQHVREDGRLALSASVVVRNSGQGAIEWNRAIAPDAPVGPHPYLVLQFYRLDGDALEQIGRAAAKHAFFAVNSACECASGNVLHPGCEDDYGVVTNLDRHHLAPRDEISAATASWTRVGSHFDGPDGDGIRSHEKDDHDSFEHRLVVRELELGTPGARYFLEGWYVTAGDTDLLNSIGRLEVAPSFAGSTWSFPSVGGFESGSILDELVDPGAPGPNEATQLLDTGAGRVGLAARAVYVGGAVHHFEYALQNFDFDAQVAAFELPLTAGVEVTNLEFRDGDDDPANDWAASVAGDTIRLSAPTGEGLDWGELVGFGFDADAAPKPAAASLAALESGPTPPAIDTIAPGAAAVPTLPGGWAIGFAALILALAILRARKRRTPSGSPG